MTLAVGTHPGGLLRERDVLVAAALATALLGAAAGAVGPAVVALAAAAVVLVVVATRPVTAAYVYLGLVPFITGIERGTAIPLLRPNEALQLLLSAAVVVGLYVRSQGRRRTPLVVDGVERSLVALVALSSLWPLAWTLLRGLQPTSDDLLACLAVVRLAGLYVLFRAVVRSTDELRRCLWLLLAGACALAVIALLEALGLVTVAHLLGSEGRAGRGQATLGSSIAVGDYLAYTLALLVSLRLRGVGRRRLLLAAGAVLVCGALGTGQFSAWIAALLAVGAVAAAEHQLRRLAVRAAPFAVLGLAAGWPVVATRLSGFGSDLGLPSSWLGRIDNLSTFYLPELWGFRWVLGVRPSSVLQAPETWREVIFLESGFLWLLWVGGVPLLLAFCWFVVAALRRTESLARSLPGERGAVARAAWGSVLTMAVLSAIDMHLTLRGGGDLLFILLGLTAAPVGEHPTGGAGGAARTPEAVP